MMPSTDAARVRFPPPFVYLLAMAAGVGIHFVVDDGVSLAAVWRIMGSVIAIAAGILFMLAAIRTFRATGQDPSPRKPSPELITDGIYRFTRNPMYLAAALLQTAIGIAASNMWIIATLPIVLALVYVCAIRHEEAYLTDKFGKPYTDYKARVRRWL